MSESAEDIVQRMQQVRSSMGDDVNGIVETARTLADWRYHLKHHPWVLLGAAAALGFVVAPRKRKEPSGDTQELIELLKQHNVGVAAPATASKSFAHTMLGMAMPFVMRGAMAAAQQRFGGAGGPLAAIFGGGGERPESAMHEEINIPR